MKLTPGDLVDQHRIVRPLGDGGVGLVYQAETPQGELVALKVLRANHLQDPVLTERFQREAGVLANLHHPNVIRLRHAGVDAQRNLPYLTLEFVPGRDLEALLSHHCPRHRMTQHEALFVLVRCARGLAALHDQGVLHRDLKPSNVLVTRSGEVKLTDFGIALRPDDVRLTNPGVPVGTTSYLAPEVLLHARWSPAADLYALGCLGIRLLGGLPPFADLPPGALAQARAERDPPPAASLFPALSPYLLQALDALLQRDPQRRPSAHQLVERLTQQNLAQETQRIAVRWALGHIGEGAFDAPPDATQAGGPPPSRPGVSSSLAGSFNSHTGPPTGPPLSASSSHLAHSGVHSGAYGAAAPAPIGLGTVLAGYRLERPLGRGAMGEVYLARHLELGHLAALKLMASEFVSDEVALARFEREVQSLAHMEHHPGIVGIHVAGRAPNGQPFYAMEYVEGRPLGDVFRAGIDREVGLDILEQLSDALGFAHTHGLIHRDVKPDNVLLGDDHHVRLTDFGLTKAAANDQQRLTLTNEIVGTPAYMAPEQAAPHLGDVGPWTDVFALGAILYELLVGTPPYLSATAIEVFEKLTSGAPVSPPRAHDPTIPPALEAVCLRALARDTGLRYPDAHTFLDALRKARAPAPPPPRKRPPLWALVGAGAALGLAAIALTVAALRPPSDTITPEAELAALRNLLAEGEAQGVFDATADHDAPGFAELRADAGAALALQHLRQHDLPSARRVLDQLDSLPPNLGPYLLGAGELHPDNLPGADDPALHARLAAWRHDLPALQHALAQLPDDPRTALHWELAALTPELTPPSSTLDPEARGWVAVARGRRALHARRPWFALVEFERVRANDPPPARLAATWGRLHAAWDLGDLDLVDSTLRSLLDASPTPWDRVRLHAWAQALTATDPARSVPTGWDGPSHATPPGSILSPTTYPSVAHARLRWFDPPSPSHPTWLLHTLRLAEAASSSHHTQLAHTASTFLDDAPPWTHHDPAFLSIHIRTLLTAHRSQPAQPLLALLSSLLPHDPHTTLLAARLDMASLQSLTLTAQASLGHTSPPHTHWTTLAQRWAQIAQRLEHARTPDAPELSLWAAYAHLQAADARFHADGPDAPPADLALLLADALDPLDLPTVVAARAQLAQALLTGEAIPAAERALADATQLPEPQRTPVARALWLLACSGDSDAARAFLALTADAPARAWLSVLAAEADPENRRAHLDRALDLGPHLPPVALEAELRHLDPDARRPFGVGPDALRTLGDVVLRAPELAPQVWAALQNSPRDAELADAWVEELAEDDSWNSRAGRILARLAWIPADADLALHDAARLAHDVARDDITRAPGAEHLHTLALQSNSTVRRSPHGRVAWARACNRSLAAAPWTTTAHSAALAHPDLDPAPHVDALLARGAIADADPIFAVTNSEVAQRVTRERFGRSGNERSRGLVDFLEEQDSDDVNQDLTNVAATAPQLDQADLFPQLSLAFKLFSVTREVRDRELYFIPAWERHLLRLPEHLPLRHGADALQSGTTSLRGDRFFRFLDGVVDNPERRFDPTALPDDWNWARRASQQLPLALWSLQPAGGALLPPHALRLFSVRRTWNEAWTELDDQLALLWPQQEPLYDLVARRAVDRGALLALWHEVQDEVYDHDGNGLLRPDDLRDPVGRSRALLSAARDRWALDDADSWHDDQDDERRLILSRVAAFSQPGSNGFRYISALQDEWAEEVGDEEDPQRRAEIWCQIEHAAREGLRFERWEGEAEGLWGLIADAALDAAARSTGDARRAHVDRARDALGHAADEPTWQTSAVHQAWRWLRLRALEGHPEVFAAALERAAEEVREADHEDCEHLWEDLVEIDPLRPELLELLDYPSLEERLRRRADHHGGPGRGGFRRGGEGPPWGGWGGGRGGR